MEAADAGFRSSSPYRGHPVLDMARPQFLKGRSAGSSTELSRVITPGQCKIASCPAISTSPVRLAHSRSGTLTYERSGLSNLGLGQSTCVAWAAIPLSDSFIDP